MMTSSRSDKPKKKKKKKVETQPSAIASMSSAKPQSFMTLHKQFAEAMKKCDYSLANNLMSEINKLDSKEEMIGDHKKQGIASMVQMLGTAINQIYQLPQALQTNEYKKLTPVIRGLIEFMKKNKEISDTQDRNFTYILLYHSNLSINCDDEAVEVLIEAHNDVGGCELTISDPLIYQRVHLTHFRLYFHTKEKDKMISGLADVLKCTPAQDIDKVFDLIIEKIIIKYGPERAKELESIFNQQNRKYKINTKRAIKKLQERISEEQKESGKEKQGDVKDSPIPELSSAKKEVKLNPLVRTIDLSSIPKKELELVSEQLKFEVKVEELNKKVRQKIASWTTFEIQATETDVKTEPETAKARITSARDKASHSLSKIEDDILTLNQEYKILGDEEKRYKNLSKENKEKIVSIKTTLEELEVQKRRIADIEAHIAKSADTLEKEADRVRSAWQEAKNVAIQKMKLIEKESKSLDADKHRIKLLLDTVHDKKLLNLVISNPEKVKNDIDTNLKEIRKLRTKLKEFLIKIEESIQDVKNEAVRIPENSKEGKNILEKIKKQIVDLENQKSEINKLIAYKEKEEIRALVIANNILKEHKRIDEKLNILLLEAKTKSTEIVKKKIDLDRRISECDFETLVHQDAKKALSQIDLFQNEIAELTNLARQYSIEINDQLQSSDFKTDEQHKQFYELVMSKKKEISEFVSNLTEIVPPLSSHLKSISDKVIKIKQQKEEEQLVEAQRIEKQKEEKMREARKAYDEALNDARKELKKADALYEQSKTIDQKIAEARRLASFDPEAAKQMTAELDDKIVLLAKNFSIHYKNAEEKLKVAKKSSHLIKDKIPLAIDFNRQSILLEKVARIKHEKSMIDHIANTNIHKIENGLRVIHSIEKSLQQKFGIMQNELAQLNLKLTLGMTISQADFKGVGRLMSELDTELKSMTHEYEIIKNFKLSQEVRSDFDKKYKALQEQYAYTLQIYNSYLYQFKDIEIKNLCQNIGVDVRSAQGLLKIHKQIEFYKKSRYVSLEDQNISGKQLLIKLKNDFKEAEVNLNRARENLAIAQKKAAEAKIHNPLLSYLSAEIIKNELQLKLSESHLVSFETELNNSFAIILADKKIDRHIDYLLNLQKKIGLFIYFKGGFSALCGVFRYSSPAAAARLSFNDFDGTIYSSDPRTIIDYLVREEGFVLTPYGKEFDGRIIYRNLEKVINGKKIELTIAGDGYKGNEFISALAAGQVCLLEQPVQNFDCMVVAPGIIVGVNKRHQFYHHFKSACRGEELYVPYAPYAPYFHKKYCVQVLKSHLKHMETSPDGRLEVEHDGFINYSNAITYIQSQFSVLLEKGDRAPHIEIVGLLKEFKQIDSSTEPFLKAYFKSLINYNNSKMETPIDSKSLNPMIENLVSEVISYIKNSYPILAHISLNDLVLENIFNEIVNYILQLRSISREPMSAEQIILLNKKLDKITESQHKMMRDEAKRGLTPLRKFTVLKHAPVSVSRSSVATTASPLDSDSPDSSGSSLPTPQTPLSSQFLSPSSAKDQSLSVAGVKAPFSPFG